MKRRVFCVILLIVSVLLSSCTPKVIEKNEQIPIQKETEHFIFKSNDTDHIEEISLFMENCYTQFDEKMDIENENKMNITIYPNKTELLNVVPEGSSQGYLYGDEVNDIMITIPEDAQTYQALLNNMYYASILITLDKLNPDIPDYIKFGIAWYESTSGQKYVNGIKEAVKNSSVPTLKELKSVKEENEAAVRDYLYALIDYIIEIYGYDKLDELINNPSIKQTFNMSEDEFYSKWIEYLTQMYPVFDNSKESDHFVIKYIETDENAIDDVLGILEDNYDRLTTDLQIKLQKKCTVNLYPTYSALQKAHKTFYLRQQSGVDAVGFTVDKETFNLLSPNEFNHAGSSYDELLSYAVHEFVHILTLNISDKLPIYLYEGIAAYESGQSDYVSITIKDALNSRNGYTLPADISELTNMTAQKQYAIYEYGYTIIEYIVKKYGYNSLAKLIHADGDIISSMGIDENGFYNGWIQYLKENYQ